MEEYKCNPIRKQAENIGIFKRHHDYHEYPKEEVYNQPILVQEETKEQKK